MDEAKAEFNWRVPRGIALAVCLAAAGWRGLGSESAGCASRPGESPSSPAAQVKPQAASTEQVSVPTFRLLNAKQGRSIVDAAKDQDQTGATLKTVRTSFIRRISKRVLNTHTRIRSNSTQGMRIFSE